MIDRETLRNFSNLVVYGRTIPPCPHCERLKRFLTDAGYEFEFRDISNADIKDELLSKAPSITTVPQTFATMGGLGEVHLGNADETILRLI